MDQNNKPLSEEARKILYNKLADTMLTAVETGQLSFEEGQNSSSYILERLDTIQTYQDLLFFLEDLSQQWPPYRTVLMHIKEIEQEHHDDKKLDQVEAELEKMKGIQ